MIDTGSAPALASVLFIRIPEFPRRAVSEQAHLKSTLEALVGDCIAPIPADERVVLDAAEGAAIVFPDNPGAALEVAGRLQTAASDAVFCVGINHGPVKVEAGTLGEPELVGDGLQAAVTVSEFATPDRFLASRSYREALKTFAPERAFQLAKAGDFTDSRIRTHELFATKPGAVPSRRNRATIIGAMGVVIILALGFGARKAREAIFQAGQPALIVLEIKPFGDIFVDGDEKGRSPPLTNLMVKAGAHVIEVRSGNLPPVSLDVELEPGQTMTLKHTFTAPQLPLKARPQQRPGFWQELKRRFGR
jgi:hypothetical protein